MSIVIKHPIVLPTPAYRTMLSIVSGLRLVKGPISPHPPQKDTRKSTLPAKTMAILWAVRSLLFLVIFSVAKADSMPQIMANTDGRDGMMSFRLASGIVADKIVAKTPMTSPKTTVANKIFLCIAFLAF